VSRLLEGTLVSRGTSGYDGYAQVILDVSCAGEEHVTIIVLSRRRHNLRDSPDAVSVVVSGKFFAIEGFLRELRNQVRIKATRCSQTGRLFDVRA